uniref:Uncharacterized protein n=1 Tax=Glossina pallidipes TaxID=7398 RepID=A0A1A9ZSE0_GLOPL
MNKKKIESSSSRSSSSSSSNSSTNNREIAVPSEVFGNTSTVDTQSFICSLICSLDSNTGTETVSAVSRESSGSAKSATLIDASTGAGTVEAHDPPEPAALLLSSLRLHRS